MRLAKYPNLEPFLDRDEFYLAPDKILIRLFDRTASAGVSLQRETRLLGSLTTSFVPNLVEVGRDEGLERLYYAMRVPGRPHSIREEVLTRLETLSLITRIGTALSNLHSLGIVYGRIELTTIALVPGGEPLLYDFSAAARIGGERMVQGLGRQTRHDRPEAQEAEYDALEVDIMAFGVFAKETLGGGGYLDEKLRQVFDKMTNGGPAWRPTSIAALLETVSSAAGIPS